MKTQSNGKEKCENILNVLYLKKKKNKKINRK